MRNLLGGKGANLAEMTNLGLPIPPGFTVTTEACTDYYHNGKTISEEIRGQIFHALAILEEQQGKKFGDVENPLLVSVRSGARASMPGMMDTILNLGLTGHGARDAVCCQTDSDARADNTKTVTDNSHNSSLSSCAAYRRILNTIPISNAPYGIWAFGTQY